MDWILKIATIILFSIINILLAKFDAKLIGKKVLIKHAISGGVYCSMIAAPYFLFDKNLWLMASLLFDRLLFFNIFLSISRNPDPKPWNYVSPVRAAITDKIAFFIFGYKGTLMYVVYAITFLLTSVMSCINVNEIVTRIFHQP